jgi:hypothetical protein
VAGTTVKRLLCFGFRRTGKAMGQAYPSGEMFFFRFYILYPIVTYLLTLPRTSVHKHRCKNLTFVGSEPLLVEKNFSVSYIMTLTTRL